MDMSDKPLRQMTIVLELGPDDAEHVPAETAVRWALENYALWPGERIVSISDERTT